MGVPVLTLEGFNFNSRCGSSINKNLGLDDLIAKNRYHIMKPKESCRLPTQEERDLFL